MTATALACLCLSVCLPPSMGPLPAQHPSTAQPCSEAAAGVGKGSRATASWTRAAGQGLGADSATVFLGSQE